MKANRTAVASFSMNSLTETPYLAVIYSIGYESRSTFVAAQCSAQSDLYGFAFAAQQVGKFSENLAWANANGKAIRVPTEARFASKFRETIFPLIRDFYENSFHDKRPRILVDISSMTRQRIADCIRVLHGLSEYDLDVDWVYAPATLDGSEQGNRAIVTNAAVVGFEGWGDPSLPVTCVVGAGFEGDLALGGIDDIEPEEVWALVPRGYSPGHDNQIHQLNSELLRTVDQGKVLEYRVDQPLETLLRLDALLGGEIANRRVVLIPLGPKVFALVCALVALSAPESVTLWRLSPEEGRVSHDRAPDGSIVGLTVSTLTEN